MGHRAQEAGLEIVNQVPEDLPRLFADVRALKQVLLNLLSNAIKFTPEGGSITLSAGLGAKGELWLSVQDTGIGIAVQHQTLVFEPFEQVESVASRRYRGTGLGLPIARKLVQLHGGEMLLESALAEGTKVTMILPDERVLAEDPSRDTNGNARDRLARVSINHIARPPEGDEGLPVGGGSGNVAEVNAYGLAVDRARGHGAKEAG